MTLVVSARIPDGVVIGVDSLSTVGGSVNFMFNAKVKCKQCGTENELKQMQLPPLQFPVSTKPYAQKLFRFQKNYGIGCYGNAFVNQRSMQSQIHTLEKYVGKVGSVAEVADKILYHFEKQLHHEVQDLNKLPPNVFPFGFQIVGFDADDETPKTCVVQIGKQSQKQWENALGITFSGDVALVQKLFQATGGIPQLQPNFQSFSLGDAVEFVQFLIRFVADYQRFANMIPTVGGDVDIAVVTSYSGFKWIHQKSLSRILESEVS